MEPEPGTMSSTKSCRRPYPHLEAPWGAQGASDLQRWMLDWAGGPGHFLGRESALCFVSFLQVCSPQRVTTLSQEVGPIGVTLPMVCRCTQPVGRAAPTRRQLWPSTGGVFLVNSWLALDKLTASGRSSSRGQSISTMTVFWMAQVETELRRQGVPGVSRIKLKATGRPLWQVMVLLSLCQARDPSRLQSIETWCPMPGSCPVSACQSVPLPPKDAIVTSQQWVWGQRTWRDGDLEPSKSGQPSLLALAQWGRQPELPRAAWRPEPPVAARGELQVHPVGNEICFELTTCKMANALYWLHVEMMFQMFWVE